MSTDNELRALISTTRLRMIAATHVGTNQRYIAELKRCNMVVQCCKEILNARMGRRMAFILSQTSDYDML